jgi:hypothetical protein
MAATDNPNDAAALAAREPPQELQEALANLPDPRTYPPRLVGLLAESDGTTGRLWLPSDEEFFGTLYVEFKFADDVESFRDIPKGDPPFPGHDVVEITFKPDAVLEIHRRLRVAVADLDAHTRERAVESIAGLPWTGRGASDVCLYTHHWVH